MKNNKSLEILQNAIKEGRPMVLFVGQSFPSFSRDNSVIQLFSERLKNSDQVDLSWSKLLKEKSITEEDYSWLSERFERNVFPESAQEILNLSWSAVLTTSFDPSLARRLESFGRRPEQVLAKDHFARVPRSRSRPPVYYLYGKSSEISPDTRPPRTRADLKRRDSAHVSEFLNRLSDTVTGNGVFVIEGFSPSHDWLTVDALLAPMSEAVAATTVWFGAPEFIESDFVEEMVQKGMLVLEKMPLSSFIPSLDRISQDLTHRIDEENVVSLEGLKTLDLTPAIRLRVEASATIIDDSWTDMPEELASDASAASFRRFHGDLGGLRGLIEGVIRGYAIERDFESSFQKLVYSSIETSSVDGGVVVLHGQSGSGKTLALSRLAISMRNSHKLPVLYASTRLPPAADIDAFCSEAERAGAPSTLVIIDANQSVGRYKDLAASLISRGRRLLIVGSTYRIDAELHDKKYRQYLVEAPAIISNKEKKLLSALIRAFQPNKSSTIDIENSNDSNMLALLYRSLSAGRGRLVTGVTQEARFTESEIRDRAATMPQSQDISSLAQQLVNLNLHDSSIFEDSENSKTLGQDAAGRLIDYVMAVGRLDCPVPFNLLMRVLKAKHSNLEHTQILYLFRDLDLFRWKELGAEGNEYAISPRIQLEAELICRRRLADTSKELECLIDLILGVRAFGIDRSSEKQFLLDLLHKLDREGPRGDVYSLGYEKIGEALKKLRVTHSVIDASLMLQESFFWRKTIWAHDGPNSQLKLEEAHRYKILNEARETVELALKLIAEGKMRASNRIKQSFKVERASIYGFLAVQSSLNSEDIEQTWSNYLAAREAGRQAIALADSYHPMDVALWTSRDILVGTALPEGYRGELLADIYSTLDQINFEQLPSEQKIKFLERKNSLAIPLRDGSLSKDAILRLEAIAPAAAVFLLARDMAQDLFEREGPYNFNDRETAKKAADYIKSQRNSGISDDRCLRLYLRLRWAESTGEVILREARGKTPHGEEIVGDLLETITQLNQNAGLNVRPADRYIEAVLAWIARDSVRADEIWQSLSRDTEYEDKSRIVRRLVATDSNGSTMVFRGTIDGAKRTTSEHWRLRVANVVGTVILLQRDFPNEDLRQGRELWDFGIAFNYIGPIADPIAKGSKK